ncbi:hypothetical protein J437_LFUL002073 [Ladona fulva]|uniref:Reverse transcriptase n=1 Tax=Ladona fulva TaxID=123851 RepID=A0A8K0JZH8_LADFU|nr:hypothetical protein J437_LFUL002073 [Ladona fulva]
MTPLLKKKGSRKCKEHRTFSLITHAAKVSLPVLNRRLNSTMEENTEEGQYGFRRGKGIRDAIVVLRDIGERLLEKGKHLYVCFVDLMKAFDCMCCEQLSNILKGKGVH